MNINRRGLLACVVVAACSGGGGGGGGGAPQDHLASLQAIADRYGQGGDDAASLTALASYSATLPDVGAASFDADNNIVDITFDDGTPAAVLANFAPDGSGADDAVIDAAYPSGVPKPGVAVLELGVGDAFRDSRPQLAALFGSGQFTTRSGDLSIAELKSPATFAGASVVYVKSHGGTVGGTWKLWTSTCVTAGDDGVGSDLAGPNPRVMTMIARNNRTGPPPGCMAGSNGVEVHYAVTAAFVAQYVQLERDQTLVYVDACKSAVPLAADFQTALFAAGAQVYAGWDGNLVDSATISTTPLFFDRVLGANQFSGTGGFAKESPPQRPFDWSAVWQDMQARGLATSAVTGAKLQLAASPAASMAGVMLGPLNPTLAQAIGLDVYGHEQVELIGQFSDTTGVAANITAQIAGSDLTITTLAPAELYAELPEGGTFSGPITVTVNGRTSNVRMMTEWRGTLDIHQLTPMTGGEIDRHWSVAMHVRQDVGPARAMPHATPAVAATTMFAAADSTVAYTATGTWTSGTASCSIASTDTDPQPIAAWAVWSGTQHGFNAGIMPPGTPGAWAVELQGNNAEAITCGGSTSMSSTTAIAGQGTLNLSGSALTAPLASGTDGTGATGVSWSAALTLAPVAGSQFDPDAPQ